ncbi:3-oxoacyl-ACP synthase III family protein [Geothrix sp. PMB-07]|uniref:3-oxoacyl-ACP synthase III family protein n=1 Tax=Geothrix sp. PMB-07 TaxID=3068640 RepID=UPI002740CC44|nr:beta-ketoacyl-ACP synthase III [Geothrix sp. PMB-07]WLT32562.1 beta-ketoacyl-ACP synthase III [Geothrix sp. PMB-07]
MRSVITGSGIGLPPNVVTNEALATLMDTSDEWIRVRSGIQERRYAEPGQGSTDLGAIASRLAIADAGLNPADIDVVLFATMTPDHVLPGNGPLLQVALGLRDIPTFDLRQQCSGFLYGLELADLLIQSGRYRRVLLVGAEVHSPFMPWHLGWDTLIGRETRTITEAERAENTLSRDRTVLFGDAAGAVVIEGREGASGLGPIRLHTDGSGAGVLTMHGASFKRRPFVSHAQIEAGDTLPVMSGKEVFRSAVTLMPQAVREVCEIAGVAVEALDLVLIHQANLRIIEGVQKALGLRAEQVPHNIERYGNTTAATLPLLFHECRAQGLIRPGMNLAFTALGSGLHWGAAFYRT